jgi:hypothetical protein
MSMKSRMDGHALFLDSIVFLILRTLREEQHQYDSFGEKLHYSREVCP